jgi:hypothetical protein
MPGQALPKKVYTVILVFLILLVSHGAATRAQHDSRLARKLSQARLAARHTQIVDGQLALIILLGDEPLTTYRGAMTAQARAPHKLDVESESSRAYLTHLSRKQDELAAKLRDKIPGATIHWRYQAVLNGMAITIPPDRVETLAAMPEVIEVYPVIELEPLSLRAAPAAPLLDTSNDVMGAQVLWDAVGGADRAGLGVKIGIIDTGVDFSNPMFQDASLTPPAGFPKTNTTETLANGKVIVAKVFSTAAARNVDPRFKTAQDLTGHGTHTASCAAGARVDLRGRPLARQVVMSGIAPKAFIGSYRVFAPVASLDSLLAALDAAVKDGMEVINMSLGFSPSAGGALGGAVFNFINQAANNAAARAVVCAAAGNEGPPTEETQSSAGGTINIPGEASRVLTVGASSNSHVGIALASVGELNVNDPAAPQEIARLFGVKGINGATSFPSDPLSARIVDVDVVDDNQINGGGLACSALPAGSLAGAIALIQRGVCFFADKIKNAASAGATAVVFYDRQGAEDFSGTPDLRGAELPAILIPHSKGLALKNFIDTNGSRSKATQATLGPASSDDGTGALTFPFQPNQLASFSSRGPTRNFAIKPDVLAVGLASYAAVQDDSEKGEARYPVPANLADGVPSAVYDPSGFSFASGTSAASPRAAGVAALLIQLHPDWSPAEIKSAIMTTAKRPSEIASLRVMDRGAGIIDMAALARVKTTVDTPSVSFGRLTIRQATTRTQTVTVKNHSDKATTYQLSVTMTAADPAVSASVDKTTLTVEPGGTGRFTLTLTIGTNAAAGTSDSEGAVSISDGGATIPSSLYLPFWVRTVR